MDSIETSVFSEISQKLLIGFGNRAKYAIINSLCRCTPNGFIKRQAHRPDVSAA